MVICVSSELEKIACEQALIGDPVRAYKLMYWGCPEIFPFVSFYLESFQNKKKRSTEIKYHQNIKFKILVLVWWKKISKLISHPSNFPRSLDYLRIESDNGLIGDFCGVFTGGEITVIGTFAVMTFHSDFTYKSQTRRFRILFSTVEPSK